MFSFHKSFFLFRERIGSLRVLSYKIEAKTRSPPSTRWQRRNVCCRCRTGVAVLRCEIACGRLNYSYGGMNDCTEGTLIRRLQQKKEKDYKFSKFLHRLGENFLRNYTHLTSAFSAIFFS